MVVPKSVIIVGDGSSGLVAANKLRYHATEKELDITVIGNSPRHFYKPDGLFIPFGYKNYRYSVKPVDFLLNGGINYVRDEVVRINAEEHTVFLKSGRSKMADYIIIATGNRFAPEEVPGYTGEAKHFYDLGRALELREAIKTFNGGKVVVGSVNSKIQYPQALFEFAFLFDSFSEANGIREKTEITFLSPSEQLSTDAGVSKFVGQKLSEKGINVNQNVTVKSVSQKNKEVIASDDSTCKYDFLVLVPPHRGQNAIITSGLADEEGYIEVNPSDLRVKGIDTVFAVGDANNLKEQKTEATSYLQASFAASKIVADAVGGLSDNEYSSKIPQIIITGKDRAFSYVAADDSGAKNVTENAGDFMLRWTSSDTYFSTIVRGMV